MSNYAHPDALVSTDWAAEHLNDPKVRFIEVDVDTSSYEKGHLPGAIGWNWQTDLNDRVRRDIVNPRAFAELNRAAGIRPDHTLAFYGDNNNWFAAWAVWQFKSGPRRSMKTAPSGAPMTFAISTARPASTSPNRRSPTAASESGAAMRGLSSNTCWAQPT